MNEVEMHLENIVEWLCDSEVTCDQAYKFLYHCVGDKLEDKLKLIIGSRVLYKKDLDAVGISKRNLKLSRYIWWILNERAK